MLRIIAIIIYLISAVSLYLGIRRCYQRGEASRYWMSKEPCLFDIVMIICPFFNTILAFALWTDFADAKGNSLRKRILYKMFGI